MQYQISCYSPGGHADTMANAFHRILPGDTHMSDLREEDTPCADVQLVGFDFAGTNLAAIPLCVMEYLEKLEDKTVFLFATIPFQPDDTVEQHIHKNLAAFLPYHCDFRGLYLCEAEPSETLLRDLKSVVSQQPENSRARYWLERCEGAVGHPDKGDIQKACRFLCRALELD